MKRKTKDIEYLDDYDDLSDISEISNIETVDGDSTPSAKWYETGIGMSDFVDP